MKDIVSKL